VIQQERQRDANVTRSGNNRLGDAMEITRSKVPDYSNWESVTTKPFYRGQLPFVERWVHGLVLDIGSNYGRFSAISPSTISLDIDKRWLIRGIELGNIKRAVVGSGAALAFRNELFDTVLAIGVTEHIPPRSMQRFLDELTRVTKPAGTLVIQTASPYAVFSLSRIRIWSDYLHPYSPFRLRRELRERGWRHLTWISSGLVGVTPVLPLTVNGLVPWAVGVTQVLLRDRTEQTRRISNNPG
jgi:SAM-dependent methyltransferase